MESLEFVRNDQWGVPLILGVCFVAREMPRVELFSSSVTGLVCAIHGMFHLFGTRHVGVTCPAVDSLKTVGAYLASVGLGDVLS